MKVLLVTRTTAARGHSAEYLKHFYNELNRKEDVSEVKCFVPKVNMDIEEIGDDLIKSDVDFFNIKKDIYMGKYGNLWKFKYGFDRIFYVYKFLADLFRKVDVEKYDIVHFLEIEYFAYYLFFKFNPKYRYKSNILFVSHSGNFTYKSNKGTSKIVGAYKQISKIPLKFLYKISKGIMLHGDEIKQQFINSVLHENDTDGKLFVAEYGTNEFHETDIVAKELACQSLNINSDETYILFFGMIREDKGIRELLHAISGMKKSRCKFLIAGMPYDITNEEIESLIDNYKIKDQVRYFPGYIEESQIKYFFSASDAIVIPYRKEFSSQSGPLKMALSFSLPIICSDVGDIGRFTVKNQIGLTFEPENIERIISALNEFLKMDKKEKERLSQNCKRASSMYSWGNMIEKVYTKYRSLI